MQTQVKAEEIGAFIRQLRKELGYTQRMLGEKIKVSDKAVSKWERGLSFPDITLLPELAEALGVSVGELMCGQRQEIQPEASVAIEEAVSQTMAYSQKSYSDRGKKWAAVILTILAAAGLICLVVNLCVSRTVSWSLYPIGAMLMLVLTAAAALLAPRHRLEAAAVVFGLTLLLYLLLIQHLTGTSGWVWPLAMPITLVCVAAIYGMAQAYCRLSNKWYAGAVSCLLLAAGPLLAVNQIIALNGITDGWGYDELIELPLLLTAAVVLFIRGRLRATDKKSDQP